MRLDSTGRHMMMPAVRNHVKRLHTPRWMCPIPTCRNTVSKQRVGNGQIARHMAKHDELGHLVGLDAPSPIQFSSLPAKITDSQTKLKYWLSTHDISDCQGEDEDQDTFTEDTERESEEPDEYEDESDDLIPLTSTIEDQVVMHLEKTRFRAQN
ncbi:uncharacterized protein K441DRAFT_682086 [Cenococcum geophilum 1.58]|uniref:Uncharacterized protein n=1 Tax=Cenococcum geophilum 1.58 TaxID=794803 RepID=A0ACC8EP37_9PEZI|nr:hypothetical protein K441DRAFT_682086 [Cenococcum geophilum 1.58]